MTRNQTRTRPSHAVIGLVLDTETTGTDFASDEVIEFGILKFE